MNVVLVFVLGISLYIEDSNGLESSSNEVCDFDNVFKRITYMHENLRQ